MKLIDNINQTLWDDLAVTIKRHSRVSIAAACFSMCAYAELKKQLETVDSFRFISVDNFTRNGCRKRICHAD